MATDDSTPWEPPLAGTEVEHLLGALNRLRATFRWKASGLDAAALNARLPSSSLTVGGLLKHLACVEDMTFTLKLTGSAPGEPWQSADWDGGPDWVFTSAAEDAPEDLYALWDAAVGRSERRAQEALEKGGLDFPAHVANSEGVHASLRRLIFDLVEEYGRHTGHADLLRESIDGLVGEDPPPGWTTE
ncbi:uncharacterized protein DUF664 [Jatrophihabitans sp. GAS493]|uniref:mycothiol transferase n=1 Tax=Jatrophihabitans sp. GAS493 TaxID=1907575 RepID=UPI000BB72CF5|nr:DUF664 domain-containing protein [Jatrophihabitans sp. GAS493]SOD73075.1 uncharacterized protein DUF664 [Jatrophihabitans sp. GAS493]